MGAGLGFCPPAPAWGESPGFPHAPFLRSDDGVWDASASTLPEVGVAVIAYRDERLFDRAWLYPPDQVPH